MDAEPAVPALALRGRRRRPRDGPPPDRSAADSAARPLPPPARRADDARSSYVPARPPATRVPAARPVERTRCDGTAAAPAHPRVIAVAGALLLAAAVALAIVSRSDPRRGGAAARRPRARYTALAGSSGPSALRDERRPAAWSSGPSTDRRSRTRCCRAACGSTSSYRGKHVLTEVIGRGPQDAGRQFELTAALARSLGLAGVQRIQWSYAASCVTSATVVRGVPDPVRDAAHHVEPTLREREPGSGIGASSAPTPRTAPTWLARFTRAR